MLGVTSYDIQGVVNVISRETKYSERRSTTEFDEQSMKNAKLTVAPGFMDYRSTKSPQKMKKEIQCKLKQSRYKTGFHGTIIVVRYVCYSCTDITCTFYGILKDYFIDAK